MASVITCEEVPAGSAANLNPSLCQKVVHLIRHGQGTHNLFAANKHKEGNPCRCAQGLGGCPYINAAHEDAKLTELGRRQAAAAGACLLRTQPVPEIVFVSPLSRTLQTATIALSRSGSTHLTKNVRVIAEERIRERNGVHVCDKRSAKEDIQGLYPTVDFGRIASGPDVLFSEQRETEEQLAARGKEFFLGLKDRPEKSIAVFTHSSFLFNTISRAFETSDPKGDKKPYLHVVAMLKLFKDKI